MLSSLTGWLGAKPTLYIIVFGATRKETSNVVSCFSGGGIRPIKRNNSRVYDTPLVRIGDHDIVFVEPTQFSEVDHYNHHNFAKMVANLKAYLENIPDKSQVRISAMYAYSVVPNHGPSLFVQRKVRYIYELCQNLDIHRFRIVPVTEKGSKVLISDFLFGLHEFQDMVDYARWKDLMMPPNLTTFPNMLAELSASNQSNLETHPLDDNDLVPMLERQDHDFLNQIQAQMQRNAIEIQRLRQDKDDGHREIAATKCAMEEDGIAHRALLSHLNLHDNHELSSIKDDFARLNNQINHYSTELSQSLVNYSGDHSNILDCSNSEGLEAFMEAANLWGFRDVIKSGRTISASLFLDFAISSIICEIFHHFIFSPFYPSLPFHPTAVLDAEEQLKLSIPVVSDIHRALRLRDPQIQAAKWRSDTFTMLTNLSPRYETKLATEVSGFIQALQIDLVSCFVDPAKLSSDGGDQIQQLTRRAIRLNHKVKTEVLRLGDLCTLHISSGAQYDENSMSVLDSGKPSAVLSTYSLGFSVTNAVGGGREPESEIVIKAQVVCESTIM